MIQPATVRSFYIKLHFRLCCRIEKRLKKTGDPMALTKLISLTLLGTVFLLGTFTSIQVHVDFVWFHAVLLLDRDWFLIQFDDDNAITRSGCCLFCLIRGNLTSFWGFQAKKSDLKEITNKVYFDVEIGGKPAGMLYFSVSL